MKTLTIFTPAYNRAHTIVRTYESLCRQTCDDFEWLIIDDGSTDDTRKWVESLGKKETTQGQKFDWMGRPLEGEDENHFSIQLPKFRLTYIYKPNGGLYTGYNVAYATIKTELCVCIDSDDFMPDNAVEVVSNQWKQKGTDKYAGIIGLDYDLDGKPIGGKFPSDISEIYAPYLATKKIHPSDTKYVLRTALMKEVCPQIGFEGEKNFNPSYMQYQVCDKYPVLLCNENFCFVEYQIGADSMSQGIFRQYINSPRSYAKMRLLHLELKHTNFKRRFLTAAHYVSSCIFSRDSKWLTRTPYKMLTILAAPLGILLNVYIRIKAKK